MCARKRHLRALVVVARSLDGKHSFLRLPGALATMIGWINLSVESFIRESFGDDVWTQLIAKARSGRVGCWRGCARVAARARAPGPCGSAITQRAGPRTASPRGVRRHAPDVAGRVHHCAVALRRR